MTDPIHDMDPNTPSKSDLNPKERQMLKDYHDKAYTAHWENIIRKNQKIKNTKTILLLLLSIIMLIGFFFYYRNANQIKPNSNEKNQAVASLVDYPFIDQQVRGNNNNLDQHTDWKLSIASYREGNYSEALKKSDALNAPFFKGMCLLQLKNYNAAIEQFDEDLKRPELKSESYYYKGWALLQLHQNEAAIQQFELALARNDLRDAWRISAENAILKARSLEQ